MGAIHSGSASNAADQGVVQSATDALDLRGLDLAAVRALADTWGLRQLTFGLEHSTVESAIGKQLALCLCVLVTFAPQGHANNGDPCRHRGVDLEDAPGPGEDLAMNAAATLATDAAVLDVLLAATVAAPRPALPWPRQVPGQLHLRV